MGPRKGPLQVAVYFLDKEAVPLREIDRTKKHSLECLICEESNQSLGLGGKLVRELQGSPLQASHPELPVSGDVASLYLLAQGGYLSHGRIISCLQGAERKVILHWLFLK